MLPTDESIDDASDSEEDSDDASDLEECTNDDPNFERYTPLPYCHEIDPALSTPVPYDTGSTAVFHLFGKLPLEIRNMICAEALPGPQIVHIVPTLWSNKAVDDNWDGKGRMERDRNQPNNYDPVSGNYLSSIKTEVFEAAGNDNFFLDINSTITRDEHDDYILPMDADETPVRLRGWRAFEPPFSSAAYYTWEVEDLGEDISKVRQIAIGRLRDEPIPFGPRDTISMRQSMESVFMFLKGFARLSDLYSVYSCHPDHPSLEQFPDLRMVEKYNWDKTMRTYDTGYKPRTDAIFEDDVKIYRRAVAESANCESSFLEGWRRAMRGGDGVWKKRIPAIHPGSILSPYELRMYQCMKATYERQRQNGPHIETLKIGIHMGQIKNSEPILVLATTSTTAKEVCEIARRERDLGPRTELAFFRDDHTGDRESMLLDSTLVLENLRWLSYLPMHYFVSRALSTTKSKFELDAEKYVDMLESDPDAFQAL